jgi:enamine deaminase RidA (YjgF/YER057c/UK114 family)
MSIVERLAPKGLLLNPGFSQVIVATGKRTVYTAGQVSIDERGELVGGGDLAAQTAQAMRNVGLALAAAGAGYAAVVTQQLVSWTTHDDGEMRYCGHKARIVVAQVSDF